MSIEKLSDLSKCYPEENPYTQVLNSVIEHIKDSDAFRMYCYLSSKSRDWHVAKEWTAKQCGIGERKAKQCWSYLERCGLLEYISLRNESGKFIKHDMRILNGTRFKSDEPFLKSTGAETAPLEKLSTDDPIHRCKNSPSGETTRVDFAPLLNKDLTNKDFETKKRKSFCAAQKKPNSEKLKNQKSKSDYREANAAKHSFAESKNNAAASQEAMAREAKHIEEHEAIKRAPMPAALRDMIKGMKHKQYWGLPKYGSQGKMPTDGGQARDEVRGTSQAHC
jgi:hypothetical protein